MRPVTSCEKFDGWVSPDDWRVLAAAWGANGDRCSTIPHNVILLTMNRPQEEMGLALWLTHLPEGETFRIEDVHCSEECSWHYHGTYQ